MNDAKTEGHGCGRTSKRALTRENNHDKEAKANIVDHSYYRDYWTKDISEMKTAANADDTASADGGPDNDGESPTKKKRTKESSRLSFPMKLHQILSNPEYGHIIRWMPHGRSWNIYDKDLLATVVCKEHFNHDNFDSFNRSVNGWGFKRLFRAGPDCKSYYHEYFLRGRPELAKLMKRLVNPGRRLPDPKGEPDFYEIAKQYPLPPDQNGEEEDLCDKVKGRELPSCRSLETNAFSTVQQVEVQVPPVQKCPPQIQYSYPPITLSMHQHHPHNYWTPIRRGVAHGNVPYLNTTHEPHPVLHSPSVAGDYPPYGHHHHTYTERVVPPCHYRPLRSNPYDSHYPYHAHQASQHYHYPPRQHTMAAGYGEPIYHKEANDLHLRSQMTHRFDNNFEPILQFGSDNFDSHCAVASVAPSYEESSEYQHQFNGNDTLEAFETKCFESVESAKQSDGEVYLNEVDELLPPVLTTNFTSRNHYEPSLSLPTAPGGNNQVYGRNRSLSVDEWNQFFEDGSHHITNAFAMEQHSFVQKRNFNEHDKELSHNPTTWAPMIMFDHR
eukprot:CCRYP_008927-RA/>CCRYP_008927-RA protein AED:0.03 eAED:0.03 QI:184/1/1/1/1/1/2/375/554